MHIPQLLYRKIRDARRTDQAFPTQGAVSYTHLDVYKRQVLYSKYAGTEVKLDGEELMIVRQSDILAIVK